MEKCGCKTEYSCAGNSDIAYCPLHKAAPELLRACKDVVKEVEKTKLPLGADLADSIFVLGKQAIASAEGK